MHEIRPQYKGYCGHFLDAGIFFDADAEIVVAIIIHSVRVFKGQFNFSADEAKVLIYYDGAAVVVGNGIGGGDAVLVDGFRELKLQKRRRNVEAALRGKVTLAKVQADFTKGNSAAVEHPVRALFRENGLPIADELFGPVVLQFLTVEEIGVNEAENLAFPLRLGVFFLVDEVPFNRMAILQGMEVVGVARGAADDGVVKIGSIRGRDGHFSHNYASKL